MSAYCNDSPIEDFKDDRYGAAPFAKSLAKSLLSIPAPVGTTIALTGPWGAGKSSTINLVRRELEVLGGEDLVVTEFKSWWFRGEEALALAFLQNLHTVLKNGLGDRIADLIPGLARRVLQTGSIVGPFVAAATVATGGVAAATAAALPAAMDYAKTLFPDGDTLEAAFRSLSKALEKEKRRFLVIIDDIDRLAPDEALAMFRLVKSVGRLPNVLYLLAFDRQLADETVARRFPSEGPHYLEKIIQAMFELPALDQLDLNDAVIAAVQEICGNVPETKLRRFMNIFYDVVAPLVTTPRHVARIRNAISVTWPPIKDEIDVADFMALEILRLYEPQLFANMRNARQRLCGVGSREEDRRGQARFEPLLRGVPEARHAHARVIIQRLFPRMEEISYGEDSAGQWDAERRVCVETHFATYFGLALSAEAVPKAVIAELATRAGDKAFIQERFHEAARTKRKRGGSMVPLLLDALNTHASEVARDDVVPLCAALFEIHDEIDLVADAGRGFMSIANTSLRYHWLIRRLTEDRFTLQERSDLYVAALQTASLGWLADFFSSADNDYHPREGQAPESERNCLTTEAALTGLKAQLLAALESAAQTRALLAHKDLGYLLYRWRDLSPNGAADVRAWTDALLPDDAAVIALAKEFTGESWTMGMGFSGELADRVSMRQITIQVRDDADILDVPTLRQRLAAIVAAGTIGQASLEIANTFLDAWDKRARHEAERLEPSA